MQEFKTLYEEAQQMSKEELIKTALPKFIEQLGKAKEVGFSNLLKEMPDVIDWFRNIINEFEIEEALPLMKKFLPLIFDAMVDQVADSEDLQDELEDMEDTSVSFVMEDADFGITLIIAEGKLSFDPSAKDDVEVKLKMSSETMKKFISGDLDPTSAYMSGDIKGEGNISKVMALRTLFEIINDEMGFELLSM